MTNRDRDIAGQCVRSVAAPAVTIAVVPDLPFLDRLSFDLYETAAVDAFVFAEVRHARLQRLLIVQFEAYLPHRPGHYAYPHATPLTIGGLPFLTDVQTVPLDPPPPVESDIGRILERVQAVGAALPPHASVRRLVHLPDAAHRQELLITYAVADGDGAGLADLDAVLAAFTLTPLATGHPMR